MTRTAQNETGCINQLLTQDSPPVFRSVTGVQAVCDPHQVAGAFDLYQYFSARARDVTPPAVRPAACVLFAAVSADDEVARICASLLSTAERKRSERFVTKELKAHFEQRRAFRRYCGAIALGSRASLAEVVFEETENGRPYLRERPDLWFSFSSCRSGFIGAWSSTHGVGVDLEDHVEIDVAGLAQMYFTESEAGTVSAAGPAQPRTFLRLWSLKEAALKSIGEGLPFGLDAFEFDPAEAPRVVNAPAAHGGPEAFRAHLFDEADACGALVLRVL
jgi:phosphopantetheinyl transferase